MTEQAYLDIDGTRYGGWKSISVTRTIEAMSGSFQLELTNKPPNPVKIGSACRVYLGDDLIITGYVDDVSRSLAARNTRYSVSGRDKAGDLVDSSAINEPGRWRGRKMEQIAADLLEPFGMAVKAEVDTGAAFKNFDLEQGETVYEAIARMAKLKGVLVISDSRGNLVLSRAGSKLSETALVEGENVKEATANESDKDRHDQIIVKGQRAGDDNHFGKAANTHKGKASDKNIARYRPLLILAEGQVDTEKAKDRAEWEVAQRIAKSLKVSVKVQGWRQKSGALWAPNTLVPVNIPSIDVDAVLLVVSCNYTLDSSGTNTQLELAMPGAYEPDPDERKKAEERRKRASS